MLDGVFFQLADTGIARVWREILARWERSPFADRIVVIDRGGTLPDLHRVFIVPCDRMDYGDLEGDRHRLQNICDEVGAGLFISTYYSRPTHTASVMAVYDMIPEKVGFDLTHPMWVQKHDLIRNAVGFASISQNTLDDLRAIFPDTASRPAIIVKPGVDASFSPSTSAERRQFREAFVRPKLDGRPFLLFVGQPSAAYKNSGLLLRALEGLAPDALARLALLFTSPDDDGIGPFRALDGLVVHRERLSDADLRLAYGTARALVYPSRYEGFGLAPLEALACGCPVVCTPTSSIPEVVGACALFVDPDDPEELRIQIDRLRDPLVRRQLRRAGIAHAKGFSWDAMATDLAEFLAGLCKDGAPSHRAPAAGSAARQTGRFVTASEYFRALAGFAEERKRYETMMEELRSGYGDMLRRQREDYEKIIAELHALYAARLSEAAAAKSAPRAGSGWIRRFRRRSCRPAD